MSSSEPNTPPQPIRRSSRSPPPIRRKISLSSANYEAGDFIKPDPCLTRQETRKYILQELKKCLSALKAPDTPETFDRKYIKFTSNPRERMYHVMNQMNIEDIEGNATEICFQIIENYCNNVPNENYPEHFVNLVLGFIMVDLLPNNRTIYSYWNHSPFEALRNAPELTDSDEQVNNFQDNTITIKTDCVSLFVALLAIITWIAITVSQLSHIQSSV